MVLGEILGLADLSGAQALGIYEVIKVVIVYKNKHFILAVFQIVMPCFEGFDNS